MIALRDGWHLCATERVHWFRRDSALPLCGAAPILIRNGCPALDPSGNPLTPWRRWTDEAGRSYPGCANCARALTSGMVAALLTQVVMERRAGGWT